MRSESRERETSFLGIPRCERQGAFYATRQKRKTQQCDRLLSFSFSLPNLVRHSIRVEFQDCRGEMTRWNVDGRATSILFFFSLRGMCSARSLTIIFIFFPLIFPSLKIKSHYLSTAVLLYNVNNAPPRIFTGLRVLYGGHVRKGGLLAILIFMCIGTRIFFPPRIVWACL